LYIDICDRERTGEIITCIYAKDWNTILYGTNMGSIRVISQKEGVHHSNFFLAGIHVHPVTEILNLSDSKIIVSRCSHNHIKCYYHQNPQHFSSYSVNWSPFVVHHLEIEPKGSFLENSPAKNEEKLEVSTIVNSLSSSSSVGVKSAKFIDVSVSQWEYFDPHGELLRTIPFALEVSKEKIAILDMCLGTKLATFWPCNGSEVSSFCIVINNNFGGQLLATGHADGSIQMWAISHLEHLSAVKKEKEIDQ
jgi:hypothetical protein